MNNEHITSNHEGETSQRHALNRADGQRFRVAPTRVLPTELETNFGNHNATVSTPASTLFTESSIGNTTSIVSRESVWTRKTFKEERTLQRINQLQQRFDRLSQDATRGTETEYLDAKFDAGGLGDDTNEILNLIDSLQEINEQSQEKIEQIHTQLVKVEKERNSLLNDNEKLTSQNDSMATEVKQWKEKHRYMEKSNYTLIKQMAEKVLSQSEEWEQHQEQIQQKNIVLQKTIGELSSDNEQLMTIQHSMEESMQLASGMSHKMTKFVQVHEVSTQSYEERLALLNKELQQSKQSEDELFNQFLEVKKENRSLHSTLKETKDIERYYQEQMLDMNAEREALEHEHKMAIRKCRESMSGNGRQDSIDSILEEDKEEGVGVDISRSSF